MKPGDSFECACGRKQPYAPADEPGGVTEAEAFQMGWTFDTWNALDEEIARGRS